MALYQNILEAIGNTPLIRLGRLETGTKIELYGKFEALNPGGSVKDRIGLAMIEVAEKEGKLKPGGTIVEATAGNTGVGLALVAAMRGYRCIFAVPDKMSEEKIRLLEAYGAEVVRTSSKVASDSPENYNNIADRLSREIPGAFRPSQFANDANPEAHYKTTGPEIWKDTDGRIDVLVSGAGTGGTITGTARYLKEQKPNITVVLADPEGSILSGDVPHQWLVEGIGEDFIPYTFDRQIVDEFVRVSDPESFQMARRLAREEGLLVGSSSGTTVAAALKYSARLREKKVVVAILPDTGRNYLSKIFNEKWLEANKLIDIQEAHLTAGDVIKKKKPGRVTEVNHNTTIGEAIALMHRNNISQMPVIKGHKAIGSVNEKNLMQLIHQGIPIDRPALSVMGEPMPEVSRQTDIDEVFRLLMGPHPAVMVEDNKKYIGILTPLDLIDCWTKRSK